MKNLSIKTRLSLAAAALVVLVIAIVGALEIDALRSDLSDGIADRQSTFVAQVARELDTKLLSDLDALLRTANALPLDALEKPTAFRTYFAERPAMYTLFDAIAVIRPDGIGAGVYPDTKGRIGQDYSERNYFKEVMRTKKPAISEPILSKTDRQPIVTMAAPVLAADGRVAGVLVGVLYLNRPNLLGDLAKAKVGRDGYFFMLTKGPNPVYVTHPDTRRLLEPRPAAGTPSTALALEGFEGTREDTNSAGVRALFSYASLKATPWVLAAVLPASEAFAPIAHAGERAALHALIAALIVAPLAWLLAARVLAPLTDLTETIRRLQSTGTSGRDGAGDADWTPVASGRQDEVGTFAQAFDALMDRLRVAQSESRTSEAWLRSITDSLPALICYIDADHRFRFNNRTYEHWLGRPRAEITGKRIAEVYGEEIYAKLKPKLDTAFQGEKTKFEVDFSADDGTTRYARGRYVPHRDASGEVVGVFGLISDETKLKEAELALEHSERRLLGITNKIPAVIGLFDMQERCLFANDVGLSMHGVRREEMQSLTFASHIDAELYAMHKPAIDQVLSGQPSVVHGQRLIGGRTVWFKAHLVPDIGPDGRQRGFYIVTVDVSTIKAAELAEARSKQKLRDITDHLPVLVSHLDASERMTYVNRMFRDYVGETADDVVGKTAREAIGATLYAQREGYIKRCLSGELVTFDVTSNANGEPRHLQTTYVPDFHPDGTVVGMTALSVDVTTMRKAEQRLSHLAHSDPLTGLPNRTAFDAQLAAIRTGDKQDWAVMYLDIDRFKQINDAHGHAAGDAVLRQFAGRLRESLRSSDFCARLGGDEFVVVLERVGSAKLASAIAGKIVARMDEPFDVDGTRLRVTASIGVAFVSGGTANAPDVLARADEALYRAKQDGRNTFRLAA